MAALISRFCSRGLRGALFDEITGVAPAGHHRIIDGKESVSFLYKVKEMIEDPSKLVFGGKDPGEVLLGL
ncbi:MAG: 2-oxo acid dehydrogenase subunit E2 [Flavobacteriales bacterium]|nr:2-oxo acid dehydrogenase subunit E2 [Flavobacteriales bacterium]